MSLLFLVLARLMFGSILLIFHTTFTALTSVFSACSVNLSFASIWRPRYLIDFPAYTCSPPMVMVISLCVLIFVMISASNLWVASCSPMLQSQSLTTSATSDRAILNAIESLATATKATSSANARKETSMGSRFCSSLSYSIFHSVDPKTEPCGTPLVKICSFCVPSSL